MPVSYTHLGLFGKCKKCGQMVLSEEVRENGYICPKCGGYVRMHARRRIKMLVDKGTFEPWFEGLEISNPLGDKAVSYTHLQSTHRRLWLLHILQ